MSLTVFVGDLSSGEKITKQFVLSFYHADISTAKEYEHKAEIHRLGRELGRLLFGEECDSVLAGECPECRQHFMEYDEDEHSKLNHRGMWHASDGIYLSHSTIRKSRPLSRDYEE